MKLLNVFSPKWEKNVSTMSTVILVTYCFLFLTAHELVDLTANLKKSDSLLRISKIFSFFFFNNMNYTFIYKNNKIFR